MTPVPGGTQQLPQARRAPATDHRPCAVGQGPRANGRSPTGGVSWVAAADTAFARATPAPYAAFVGLVMFRSRPPYTTTIESGPVDDGRRADRDGRSYTPALKQAGTNFSGPNRLMTVTAAYTKNLTVPVSAAIYLVPGPPGGNVGLQVRGTASALTDGSDQWQRFKIELTEVWCFDSRIDRERHRLDLARLR